MKTNLFQVLAVTCVMAFPLLINAQDGGKKQVVPPAGSEYAPAEPPTAADFTDEEITKFSKVVESITELQADAEQEMIKAIEAEGMNLDEFNRVAQAQQTPDQSANLTDAEREKFTKVNEKMQEIQVEMQPKLIEAIEEQDMDVAQYQSILQVYQQDPALQQKVQAKIQN